MFLVVPSADLKPAASAASHVGLEIALLARLLAQLLAELAFEMPPKMLLLGVLLVVQLLARRSAAVLAAADLMELDLYLAVSYAFAAQIPLLERSPTYVKQLVHLISDDQDSAVTIHPC